MMFLPLKSCPVQRLLQLGSKPWREWKKDLPSLEQKLPPPDAGAAELHLYKNNVSYLLAKTKIALRQIF
jgi:hypothetical protein